MDIQENPRWINYTTAYRLTIAASCIMGIIPITLTWLVPIMLMWLKARRAVGEPEERTHKALAICTIIFVNGPFGIAAGIYGLIASNAFKKTINKISDSHTTPDLTTRRRRFVFGLDAVSLGLTISGVILYVLSVLALQKFWAEGSDNADHIRVVCSIVFTAVAVAFDFSSVCCDITSFFLGKKNYKSLLNNTADEVENKLTRHEKLSYIFDQFSFFSSTIGLCCGIISLVLITAVRSNTYDTVSWAISLGAVLFDGSSALLLILGIAQHTQYWDTKEIIKLTRESMNMSVTRK